MVTDPIGDLFSEIRNSSAVSKPMIEVFHSNFRESVAKFLKKQGFITDLKIFKDKNRPGKRLRIDLAYRDSGESSITLIKRVSKPGSKIYMNVADLRKFRVRPGEAIVSTSQGIMTGREAVKRNLGGEVLGEVW